MPPCNDRSAEEADDANVRRLEPSGLGGHERRHMLPALPGTVARCNKLPEVFGCFSDEMPTCGFIERRVGFLAFRGFPG